MGDLQAQVADLKSSTVEQLSDVRQTAQNQPRVSLAGGRPSFATADGQFTAALRGQLQLDTAAYLQPSPGPITSDFRRTGPALGASASNVDLTHARDLKDGTLWRRARADGSYASANDPRVLAGLGSFTEPPRVKVTWPDGRVEEFANVPIDRYVTLKEGTGSQ